MQLQQRIPLPRSCGSAATCSRISGACRRSSRWRSRRQRAPAAARAYRDASIEQRPPRPAVARSAIHHLHRSRQLLPQHRRAQDVVPIDHRLQAPRSSSLQPLPRRQRQQSRQDIGIAALLVQQVMEQDAFLQRRQRVDVLDVGRAAGHALHDPLDVLRLQLHQRQHLRRDRSQPARNQVRRHLELTRPRPLRQLDSPGPPASGSRIHRARRSHSPTRRSRSIICTISSE